MTNQVFVYGSFTEGMVHFSKIQAFIESSQKAKIRGAAYRLKVGYPVLLKDGDSEAPGQLITLKSPEFMISLLDEFFGFANFDAQKSLHLRELTEVNLENGEKIQAWAYFLNPKKLPNTAVKIDAVVWDECLKSPKFTDQLTERQVTYIRRLGAVTGREVVPIDLPLYRELMNLELIVDKGRRLALSKFGQEVYRYLGDS